MHSRALSWWFYHGQTFLIEISVALDKTPLLTKVEYNEATRLSRIAYHPKIIPKIYYNALCGFYQDWVHRNTRNDIYGRIKEDGNWQARWKNLSIFQLNATTNFMVKSGKRLSQFSQWNSIAHMFGTGTPGG